MAQLADKTGISGFSNQNTPEYLRKAKPAKYLRSRHKYLLLRVRSYPQIIANYRRAPTLRPRTPGHCPRSRPCAGSGAAPPALSAPAGSVPSPSRSARTESPFLRVITNLTSPQSKHSLTSTVNSAMV